MIKKNYSESRFKTAGARVPYSRKLPRDFFPPSKHYSQQYSRLESIWSRHNTVNENNQKDNLQFTFRRATSEQKKLNTTKPLDEIESINQKIRISILPSIKIKDKNHLTKLTKLPAKYIKVTFPDISELQN